MKCEEKNWWDDIEIDPSLDYRLEIDDCWQNRYDEQVRYPSDLLIRSVRR